MTRVYNFSAGPAVLPEEVLKQAAAEMLDYQGTGMSVMEMSHRSKPFQKIIDDAEADLRDLMGIPENYKVLFVQGGATTQFAAIPMNLMKNGIHLLTVIKFEINDIRVWCVSKCLEILSIDSEENVLDTESIDVARNLSCTTYSLYCRLVASFANLAFEINVFHCC